MLLEVRKPPIQGAEGLLVKAQIFGKRALPGQDPLQRHLHPVHLACQSIDKTGVEGWQDGGWWFNGGTASVMIVAPAAASSVTESASV